MKILLTFFICLSFSFGYSQKLSSVDVIVSIDGGDRTLHTSTSESEQLETIRARNKEDMWKTNMRIGFNLNYSFSDSIHIKTGLNFSRLGHDGPRYYLRDEEDNFTKSTKFSHSYYFIEAPFICRYEFRNGIVFPFIELGIIPSYLVNYSYQAANVRNPTTAHPNTSQNFNRIHLFGFISLGVSATLRNNYEFFVQASARQDFVSLTNSSIREYLYSTGVEVGIRKLI